MLQLGQVLEGRLGSYKLTQKLYDSVWVAVNQQVEQKVIVKHKEHFCMGREREVLRHFQDRTPHIRPLLDDIEMDPKSEWPALVMPWLDDDLLHASNSRKLTRTELKRVGTGVLKTLEVLHDSGYVHTDIKPSNVLVNFDQEKQIGDVQLADFGSTVHQEHQRAKSGAEIGAAIFRSTEAMLAMPWSTSTDVWSFGAMIISLIYGRDFHIFSPDVSFDDDEYEVKILLKHCQIFGPFPLSFQEIADDERLAVATWLMDNSKGSYSPFHTTDPREVCEEDMRFLLKIMKIDPRDRPTVQELLADEWFTTA